MSTGIPYSMETKYMKSPSASVCTLFFFPQLHTSDDPSTHLMTSTTGIPQQPSFQISRGHRPRSSWPAGGGGNDSCSAISGGFHPKNRRVSKDEANMAILIRKTCRLCRLCIKNFGVIHGRNTVGS